MKALGTYNFAGDIGKMTLPALASVMLVVLPWQPTLAILGGLGFVAAAAIVPSGAAFPHEVVAPVPDKTEASAATGPPASSYGFAVLLTIGMVDSATRMAFLTFLPFVLLAKGASLPTVGPGADPGVRRRRGGQAGLRLHRRTHRRDRDRLPDRRADHARHSRAVAAAAGNGDC